MKSRYILLVEDNPSDIELTKRALEKSRVANQLLVVEDGQQAIEFLFGRGPAGEELPALILLDLKLPLVDGLEVLRRIRSDRRTRRLPVVVLTSSREDADVAASYDEGVNSYITKPVDFSQFVEAIQHLGLYWLILNEPPPTVGK